MKDNGFYVMYMIITIMIILLWLLDIGKAATWPAWLVFAPIWAPFAILFIFSLIIVFGIFVWVIYEQIRLYFKYKK